MVKCETAAAIITRLAALPCPTCGGCGRTVGCPTCDGSGVRFPWLRDACICASSRRSAFYSSSGVCGQCEGKGWLPRLDISVEDMLANLSETAAIDIARALLGALWRDNLPRTVEDVRLAFWQAVEKAIEASMPPEPDNYGFTGNKEGLLVLNFSDGCHFPVGGTDGFLCYLTLPVSVTCPHNITATISSGPAGTANIIETAGHPYGINQEKAVSNE